eukprot:ctg_1127.g227
MPATDGHIDAGELLLGRHAQHTEELHGEEVAADNQAHKAPDIEDLGHLRCQLLAITVENTPRTVRRSVRHGHVVGLGEETARQHAPSAAKGVHRNRLQRVVDTHADYQFVTEKVHKGADDSDAQRRVGRHRRTRCRDNHQPAHETVGHDDAIERAVDDFHQQQSRPAACCRQHQRVDCRQCHRAGLCSDRAAVRAAVIDEPERAQLRPWVETEPPEPQQKAAQHRQARIVGGHRTCLAVLVEATDTWADDDRAHERARSTGDVHHTAAGKVDRARSPVNAVAIRAPLVADIEPAVLIPHGVRDDRIHETHHQEHKAHVGVNAHALGDSTGHDGRCRQAESELKPPQEKRGTILHSVVLHRIEREAPTQHVVRDAADARITTDGGQRVASVLFAHAAHGDHGETGLHAEHQGGGQQQKGAVHAVHDVGVRQARLGERRDGRAHRLEGGVVHGSE